MARVLTSAESERASREDLLVDGDRAVEELNQIVASAPKDLSLPLLLDIGCGPARAPGHVGLDRYPFPGVDVVRDLRRGLPFNDSIFDGVRAHHVLEHFTGDDLLFVVDEMWRVTKPGGQLEVTVPDATSPNRYRDPTHLERDWHEDSFMLWQVDINGQWQIFVGPAYQRHAKLRLLTTATNPNLDRRYRLEVMKL